MANDGINYCIQFYVSIVAYFILHMIFVISSDFVEAFNIPPLNIGIYVDKLAAIRALLMVIADIIEWGSLDNGAGDYSMDKPLTEVIPNWEHQPRQGARRLGSILSFIVMLGCRSYYLWAVYESDNKSLSVFITLCIEGFWFGVFQMSFFAIGPEYNAATSLGIHTMGNFIFFLQLILQHQAKSKPKINSLYRVRVHAWICLISSLGALAAWLYFCIDVDADEDLKKIAKQLKDADIDWAATGDNKSDGKKPVGLASVWSPFWLFIVGAFAEDFAVPGILPFAFLDTDKAALVNYLTPLFFMTGAVITFFLNDIFGGLAGLTGSQNSGFKEWSASFGKDGAVTGSNGKYWHGLWLLNVPKYIAFFIAMWAIHGTFGRLRCIVQCRWRVMLLTMIVVIPRAWLETAGYVGVANYAIGLFATSGFDQDDWIGGIQQNWKPTAQHMLRLCAEGLASGNAGHKNETAEALAVKANSQETTTEYQDELKLHQDDIAIEIEEGSSGTYYYKFGGANSSGFMFIAFHDMIAMFCRFVYGKFKLSYNTIRSLSYRVM